MLVLMVKTFFIESKKLVTNKYNYSDRQMMPSEGSKKKKNVFIAELYMGLNQEQHLPGK